MNNDLLSFYISNYNASSIKELKYSVEKKQKEHQLKIARQVESIFVEILIKNMRNSLPKNELFDNDQSRLYMDIYDQQIAQEMTKKGIGLTKVILQQIDQNKKNYIKNNILKKEKL